MRFHAHMAVSPDEESILLRRSSLDAGSARMPPRLLCAGVLLALFAPARCVVAVARAAAPRFGRPASLWRCSRCAAPPSMLELDRWQDLALRERYPRLQNLSSAILVRRTIEEAELAIKLESEFKTDPSILQARARICTHGCEARALCVRPWRRRPSPVSPFPWAAGHRLHRPLGQTSAGHRPFRHPAAAEPDAERGRGRVAERATAGGAEAAEQDRAKVPQRHQQRCRRRR